MSELQDALAAADEAYLTGLSNRGTYKRACKDAEADGITADMSDTSAEVHIGGEVCTLKVPLWESVCTCPSRSICRHLVAAIVWMRSHEDIPDAPGQDIPDVPDAPAIHEETQPVESKLEPEILSEKETAAVRACAADGCALLCDILRWGTVRLPENLTEHIEAMAVRCHALKMADAELMFRSIGTSLEESRSRRAVFRAEQLLGRICRTAAYLDSLQKQPVTAAMLGTFRNTYETLPHDLTLLPIGERKVTSGDHTGVIYYFLNMDEQAEQHFFTLSDLRPAYYDTVSTKRMPAATAWGAGVPVHNLMHTKLTLHHAKVCGSKLSTSGETIIAMQQKADLDCDVLRHLVCTDFSQIIRKLAENPSIQETDHLFFLHPEQCLSAAFDSRSQQYRMTITDAQGYHVEIQVRYRAEEKHFIEQLEKIGESMLNHPETTYVWFCSAWIEGGRLSLRPIEVYDFITLPESVPQPHIPVPARHAAAVLALTEEAEHQLCSLLQSGLRQGKQFAGLARKAEEYGMQGFADLLTVLHERADGYRHSTADTAADVLHALTDAERYLYLCRHKVEILTALAALPQ